MRSFRKIVVHLYRSMRRIPLGKGMRKSCVKRIPLGENIVYTKQIAYIGDASVD